MKSILKKQMSLEPFFILILLICSSVEFFITLSQSRYVNMLSSVKYSVLILLSLSYLLDTYKTINKKASKHFSNSLFLKISLLLVAILETPVLKKSYHYICIQKQLTGEYELLKMEILFFIILPPVILLLISSFRLQIYTAWFKKHKKKLFIMLYLFVWLWFGGLYFYLAQRADGEYYTFTDTDRREAVTRGITRERAYSDAGAYYINNIIKENEYKVDYLEVQLENQKLFFVKNQIGSNWGRFYQIKLAGEGYTHFYSEPYIKRFILTPYMINNHTYSMKWNNMINGPFIMSKVKLYKLKEYSPSAIVDIENDSKYAVHYKNIKADKELLLVYTQEEYVNMFRNFAVSPINYIDTMLADSHILLGSECIDIGSALHDYSYYPLEDFLYFSAVIITTLGFGDITPNNSGVRIFVMLESLIGVIIMGIYVSLIGASKDDEN